MTISDHVGRLYTVNKPNELIDALDIDNLISIFKYTYLSMRMSEDIDGLIANGLIESINENNEPVDYTPAVEGLIEGFNFLKEELIKKLSEDDVNEIVEELMVSVSNSKYVNKK